MPRAMSNVSKGEETRDSILKAAVENFAVYGYRGASLSKIASQCGVGQSAILHHFGSKERILMALLERYFNREGTLFNLHALADGKEAFFKGLESIVESNRSGSDRAALVRFYSVMVGESLTEGHPAQKFFAERFDYMRAFLSEAFLQANAPLGDEPKMDAGAAYDQAALLVAAMDGLQLQWLLNPELDMTKAFKLLTASLRTPLISA